MLDLSKRELKYIPGVGPARAELLNKELNILNQEDLLYYFPYKYIDRSKFYKISELTSDVSYVQLRGRFSEFTLTGTGRSKRMTSFFYDGTGKIEIVWFKGLKYIVEKYQPGTEYIIFGKPSVYGHQLNIAHPDIETPSENASVRAYKMQPFYNTTEKMKSHYVNSRVLHSFIIKMISGLQEPIPETLPEYILKKHKLMPLNEALLQMHMPTDQSKLKQAKYRLTFEELFYIQLHIVRYMRFREKKYKGYPFKTIGEKFNNFYHNYLPFQLTDAQKRVLREIRTDMGREKQMNRLLQGDVGSGKTLVALMCMLMAADNGFQSAIMAPTEILANQHFTTISELLKDMDVKIALLTGSTKKKERVALHEGLRNGDISFLVGTHALIEETVQFKNLGLVVIDEQHRFGVEQRSKLWLKNEMPPHVLVMTATPIPRTLAMTVYGDLDVSVIDQLPPGRKPIRTEHRYDNKRGPLYSFIKDQINAGRQIYIVFPLIKESEKSDYKNLEDGYKHLKEVFPDVSIGMVHGKLKPAEKDEAMNDFVLGRTRILVATTVIEVGVNVPNASVMMIESAERFGLSQLHQLRGRVGRGAEQSYCILVTSFKLSEDSRKRIEIITGSNDGFEIAEADLKLRGPGDLEGTQQSGIPFDLKIANLGRDVQLLEYVRNLAISIIDKDSELSNNENAILRMQLSKLFAKKINWGVIS